LPPAPVTAAGEHHLVKQLDASAGRPR
jgi:hypothetical protein